LVRSQRRMQLCSRHFRRRCELLQLRMLFSLKTEMLDDMMKRMMLAFALMLLPTAAMAQHADHAKAHDAAKPSAGHMNFAQELIAAKADLKLSAAQIQKLEVFSARMDEHHRKMAAHHGETMSHEEMAKMESKMHTDLFAVFTEEQLVKVRPMMKVHMDKCEHMKGAAKKADPHKH
jgi:hypothetical protein